MSLRRQPKAFLFVHREDTDARKHAHEAEECQWISTYSLSDFTAFSRAVRKLIGDGKPGRSADSLAYPIARDDLKHLCRWRKFVAHRKSPSCVRWCARASYGTCRRTFELTRRRESKHPPPH